MTSNNQSNWRPRLFLTAISVIMFALFSPLAKASPVNALFHGAVKDYYLGVDLLPLLPIGTPVSFAVSFNDVASDGVIDRATETIGPVSGSLDVGGRHYTLSGFSNWFISSGWLGTGYSFGSTGTGPDVGDGSFSGLYLDYYAPNPVFFPNTPAGWGNEAWLGYGFQMQGGGTSFGYLTLTGDLSVMQVPEPASILLVSLGIAGFAVARRRREKSLTA